jgi:hypothetical protein
MPMERYLAMVVRRYYKGKAWKRKINGGFLWV